MRSWRILCKYPPATTAIHICGQLLTWESTWSSWELNWGGSVWSTIFQHQLVPWSWWTKHHSMGALRSRSLEKDLRAITIASSFTAAVRSMWPSRQAGWVELAMFMCIYIYTCICCPYEPLAPDIVGKTFKIQHARQTNLYIYIYTKLYIYIYIFAYVYIYNTPHKKLCYLRSWRVRLGGMWWSKWWIPPVLSWPSTFSNENESWHGWQSPTADEDWRVVHFSGWELSIWVKGLVVIELI